MNVASIFVTAMMMGAAVAGTYLIPLLEGLRHSGRPRTPVVVVIRYSTIFLNIAGVNKCVTMVSNRPLGDGVLPIASEFTLLFDFSSFGLSNDHPK